MSGREQKANKNPSALKDSAKQKPGKRAALENRSGKQKSAAGTAGHLTKTRVKSKEGFLLLVRPKGAVEQAVSSSSDANRKLVDIKVNLSEASIALREMRNIS